MMHLPASVRVYLCAPVCDMRKSLKHLRSRINIDLFRMEL